MHERLAWIKRKPQNWTDWEPVRGGVEAHEALMRDFGPHGLVIERLPHRQQVARQRWQQRLCLQSPEW